MVSRETDNKQMTSTPFVRRALLVGSCFGESGHIVLTSPSWISVAEAISRMDGVGRDVVTLMDETELNCMEIAGGHTQYHVAVVRQEEDVFAISNGTPAGDEFVPLIGNYYPKHQIITDVSVVLRAAETFFATGGLDEQLSWVDDNGTPVY